MNMSRPKVIFPHLLCGNLQKRQALDGQAGGGTLYRYPRVGLCVFPALKPCTIHRGQLYCGGHRPLYRGEAAGGSITWESFGDSCKDSLHPCENRPSSGLPGAGACFVLLIVTALVYRDPALCWPFLLCGTVCAGLGVLPGPAHRTGEVCSVGGRRPKSEKTLFRSRPKDCHHSP